MKRDPKAIDEIETLDDAKEILKMITGNVYLNGEIYSLQQDYSKRSTTKCLDFTQNS